MKVIVQEIYHTVKSVVIYVLDYIDIKDQPTAYDIDDVIEQLNRCYGIVRCPSVDYAEGLKDAYERAIGIVEAGGTWR